LKTLPAPRVAPIHGFAPIADRNARVLILGSMPGIASLTAHEYYAHPQNGFWPMLEAIWGIPRTASYAARTRAVKQAGIAIWDVLRSCTRRTSLDSDIEPGTTVVNDFATFLRSHRRIHTIAFNGGAAANLFRRHVLPTLPVEYQQLRMLPMPSTSPAHARLRLADKLVVWRALAQDPG
jgi:double-stranded uracil-DNA glycosylase